MSQYELTMVYGVSFLILFVFALRAVYFLSIKEDPIKTFGIKTNWFGKKLDQAKARENMRGIS